jgi:hypothetical protein
LRATMALTRIALILKERAALARDKSRDSGKWCTAALLPSPLLMTSEVGLGRWASEAQR